MSTLRLRPVRAEDAEAVLAAHEAMATEAFPFALGYRDGMSWQDYLEHLARSEAGIDLPEDSVPSLLLVAEADGTIVGRASVRHALNELLAHEGGHVGFGVLPDYRRRGLATEILHQALAIARSLGVARILVCCDDDNVGSARTIERCGGRLGSTVVASDGVVVRRYWID